jgi:hypothetical protein
VTRNPGRIASLLSLAGLVLGTGAAFAQNEATAPVPPPLPPSAAGPMSPVQKQAPAASAAPSIAMPTGTPAAKPDMNNQTAAPKPTNKPADGKEAAPADKPAAENAAKPPEKTVARPKRPVPRREVPERDQAMRDQQPYTQDDRGYYSYPPPQYQQYRYQEERRESEGPDYRAPPAYRPVPGPSRREAVEAWQAEPRPYGYAPPPYAPYEVPWNYAPYPGPPRPPWGR